MKSNTKESNYVSAVKLLGLMRGWMLLAPCFPPVLHSWVHWLCPCWSERDYSCSGASSVLLEIKFAIQRAKSKHLNKSSVRSGRSLGCSQWVSPSTQEGCVQAVVSTKAAALDGSSSWKSVLKCGKAEGQPYLSLPWLASGEAELHSPEWKACFLRLIIQPAVFSLSRGKNKLSKVSPPPTESTQAFLYPPLPTASF